MNLTLIHQWINSHFWYLVMLPANLLALQAVIVNAAEAHGYTKSASWLRKIGNFLSFLADVVSGILAKKQPPEPPAQKTGV